ncbi:MAG: tRNA (adenosine(37)-N6)-threonylcarbamoyltransferase complex dimerization subunit type 1 TsaB [Mariprofundales bacterium]
MAAVDSASTTLLALDAATGNSVALLRHQHHVFSSTGSDKLPHSRALIPQLEALLSQAAIDWAAIDTFALGCGPGSFTGIRIAAATINGINASLQQPIVALDSLAITAAQSDEKEPIWVIEDARAGECFAACYRDGATIHQPCLMQWNKIATLVGSSPVISRAAKPDNIHNSWSEPNHRSRVMALEKLCQNLRYDPSLMPRTCYPRYMQPTQAER